MNLATELSIILNPFCRITPSHAIYGWSAAQRAKDGIQVHPALLQALRELSWPLSIAETLTAFKQRGFIPPSETMKSLMGAHVLVSLDDHVANLALLKGTGILDLSPFIMNEYCVEYLRSALRLGLEVIARDPATIEIFNSSLRHVIRYAHLLTLETEAAAALSERKDLCTARWRALELPIPSEIIVSRDRLQEAPERLGFPLVIKPIAGAQGKGVFANVKSPEEIARIQTFFGSGPLAQAELLVQAHIPGTDHRLLVVNGHMVAASQRLCPFVIGDGISTIRQLQSSPTIGSKFSFTESGTIETMRSQNLTLETVLPKGRKAMLNHKANLCTGGFAVDVTDSIHPTIQAAAGCAVAAIGLRVAGLDFICEDASLPLNEGGGCFIEVNTQPGVESHLYPDIGIAHPVCDEIIRFMFQVP